MKLTALDRRIISLAIPALGTLAIEPIYILVDTAIVGRLGTDPLAGLAIAGTVLLTVLALFGFMQTGVTPLVAHALGASDTPKARVAASDSLWLALLLGVPVGVTIAALAPTLARALGARAGVLDAAVTYLRISAIGIPFVLVALVGHGVMRGYNDLRLALKIVLVANVVNVVAELITVYGLDMGVAGSALSTVIVQILAAGAFALVLSSKLARVRPRWQRMRPILVAGGHLGIRSIAMLAVWLAVTRVAAGVDTATLAAHQVLFQLFLFLALVLDALAIPAQSLVAGALGASDRDAAMGVGWSSTKLSLWLGCGFCVLVAALSPVLGRVFSDDDDVVTRVSAGLLFLAVMQIPGAVAFALDGVLIGGRDQRFLGRVAVVNLISFAPFLVATLVEPRLGIAGLWGGQLAWMVMRATVNFRRFRSQRWMPQPAASLKPQY